LINPGFPFIAAPRSAFEDFKDKLEAELIKHKKELICKTDGWCYVLESCSTLTPKLPKMAFQLGKNEHARHLVLPASNYFIDYIDDQTQELSCHLGIVGNSNAVAIEEGRWVLGRTFMSSYYTTFNATNSTQPSIGFHIALEESTLGAAIDPVESESYWYPFIAGIFIMISALTAAFAFTQCRNAKRTEAIEEARESIREQKEHLYEYEDADSLDNEEGTIPVQG
jgi:hypothetical protein